MKFAAILYLCIDIKKGMADRLTKEQRHNNMSHIRAKDTKPEVSVRKELFKRGFRFRKNVRNLPGCPDIVLPKYHTAIFVNGCFWHGHNGCAKFVVPSTNREFWLSKISRNIQRDEDNTHALESAGWKVITVWECTLSKKSINETIDALAARICENYQER